MMCEGRALARMVLEDPFADEPSQPDIVRFVSVLPKISHIRPDVAVAFPSDDKWLVRVIGSKGQFVVFMYRRHMRTIGYLGQLDRLFGPGNYSQLEHHARNRADVGSTGIEA